jgi:hypothetical protein
LLAWDTGIILLALFNSLIIPVCLAYKAPFCSTGGYTAINLIIDAIFLVDILINFRTSRVNILTGEEVKEPKKLAKQYILSYAFWCDLLSSIPFDKMGDSDFLSLFGMLKIIRL